MKEKLDPSNEVGVNKTGWYCIRHDDGWFVGTEKGVTCYRRRRLAVAAWTLVTEREQRRCYRIEVFRGYTVKKAGEHTPVLSAEKAWKNLERRK